MTPEEIQAIADGTEAFVKSHTLPLRRDVDHLAESLREIVTALVAADGALAQRITALEEGEPEATQTFVEIDPRVVEPDELYAADRAAFFGPKRKRHKKFSVKKR